MKTILTILRTELDAMSNHKSKESAQRYFKEELRTRGIKTPLVWTLAKNLNKELKAASKEEIFKLCDELWESGYIEESFVACEWAYSRRKQFEPADFKRFEKWIKNNVNNWASCDTFCNKTVGAFLLMYPDYVQQLKKWPFQKTAG